MLFPTAKVLISANYQSLSLFSQPFCCICVVIANMMFGNNYIVIVNHIWRLNFPTCVGIYSIARPRS